MNEAGNLVITIPIEESGIPSMFALEETKMGALADISVVNGKYVMCFRNAEVLAILNYFPELAISGDAKHYWPPPQSTY